MRLDALDQRNTAAPSAEPQGLDVGTEFPSFNFPNLAGKPIALDDFRGKRVLLIHWSPQCGFCDLIAPDLARLQPDFDKRGVQLLLLAQGETEANSKLAEEHGLKCPILLYKDAKVPEPLANLGTPSAYLLDTEGRVARPLAIGSDKVAALAEEAANGEVASFAVEGQAAAGEEKSKRLPGDRPLSASRIVRDGLKAGTPAPAFNLPDVYGRTVSLEEFRGRRLLLVFSDPHCGPCEQLAAQLAQLHKKHANNGLAFVMVGRGEVEENREKAEQHGIQFPVVMQEKWRLSKEYGIFSTPVAFLVNADGVIAKDVAVGSDSILALAEEGLRQRKEQNYELSYR